MDSFMNHYYQYTDLPEKHQQMVRCVYFYCAKNANQVLPVCFCPKQEVSILQKDIRFLNEIGFDYRNASISSLKKLLTIVLSLGTDKSSYDCFHLNSADIRWMIERMIDIKKTGFEYHNKFIDIEAFFSLLKIGIGRTSSQNGVYLDEKNMSETREQVDANDIKEIVLFSHKSFPALSNWVVSVSALIQCSNRSTPVLINLYYDKKNHEYYMNSESYRLYSEQYGLMPYPIRLVCSLESERTGLNEESELYLCGYSVSKEKGLSDKQRQALLKQIIDLRILEKSAIINHIEYLIHYSQNQRKKEVAVEKWKRDLIFVNTYNICNQPVVRGTFTDSAGGLATRFDSKKTL